NRARGIPGAEPAHLAHAAAQILDRVENLDRRVAASLGKRVAIVGAGYAGMAAAVAVAQRGGKPTVFEAGPVPGGRARRVSSQGTELDNGQHILIGAYSALYDMMRTVGVPENALLRMPLEVRYARGFSFRRLWLPEPFGLAGGLLTASGVPLAERIRAARFFQSLKSMNFRLPQDVPVAALLEREKQNGRLAHYLWRPLCISALNTPPELASANVFLAVLRDTL